MTNEYALLHAKAAVCDAYRKWLARPNNQKRQELTLALMALNRIEQRHVPGKVG